jgi:hypothetical protein
VGSRVQVAASACFVASGLFICGLGGALAFAEPAPAPERPGATDPNVVLGGSIRDPLPLGPRGGSDDGSGNGPKKDSDGNDNNSKPRDDNETGEEQNGTSDDDADNGNGGNPSQGNCGNTGSNGNAQGCGGGSQTETTDPTETTATETTTSQTTTSETTTTSRTTTSRTTTTRTTTTTATSTSTTTTSPPGLPAPGGGGGGGGGGGFEPPSGRPEPPQMQLPPQAPTVVSVVPGLGVAAAELPLAPITLPVIVAPLPGVGGGGAPAAPANPALPGPPRAVAAEPPAARDPLPANVGSNIAVPASSYRIGYADYLRSAGIPQVAALAVPGVGGMLVLTAAGGLVGYRQAKAGHAVRTGGAARFVN